jgi:hypothetical protein
MARVSHTAGNANFELMYAAVDTAQPGEQKPTKEKGTGVKEGLRQVVFAKENC